MFLRACLSFASPSYFSPAAALHLRRATVVSVSSSSLQPSPNKQQRRSFAGSSNKYDIKKVGVVGLGLMGHGIGLVSAQAGYEVIAVEAQAAALESGKKRMDTSLTKLLSKAVEKGKMTKEAAELEKKAVEGRITYSLDVKSLKDVDLVVEAIVENLDVKIPFYKHLGSLVKPNAIFGSNTSSLKISDFADPSGRPEKFVGLHFFNPVQLMRLVEIVKLDKTEQGVFEAVQGYVKRIGKTAVTCKDTPGFIVNRLLVPALVQAMLMKERGDASVEDIDVAMQLGAGHPMGPLHLADYIGLDTCLFILEGWVKKYPDEPAFLVPSSLRTLVSQGKLGRKSGEGFYMWQGDKIVKPVM
ncbi:hydroxyacyl-coenzyme a mitochondrial precursor [Nannochloropsis oceanica]